MSASGPGCVKTPQPTDGRGRLQTQHDLLLINRESDNVFQLMNLASSENVEGLKTIVDGRFLVFTQPGPTADIQLV